MASLYELSQEYQALLEILEDGEASEEAINDTMGLILDDIEDKMEGYGKVLKTMQADAEALKQEKMRIAARQKAIENGMERLRDRLKAALQITGQKKVKTKLFTFGITTREKAVLDVDLTDIPEEFVKVTYEAKMNDITKYLKENRAYFAHLEQVDSLTVR